MKKRQSTINELKEQTGKEASVLKLDLADLKSVTDLKASEFLKYAARLVKICAIWHIKIFQQRNGACLVQQCVRGLYCKWDTLADSTM